MKNFFKSVKAKVMLCILSALLLGVLFACVTDSAVSPYTSAAGVVYAPFQKIATYIAEKTADWKSSFASASVYKDEIAELESEALVYKEQLVDYERTKQKLNA